MIPRLLISVLACSLALGAIAAPRTEIIPLSYRTADDVLPVAQSVLGNEGRVSAYGNQLVVNAEPAKIRELQEVLNQLDTRPHRLLISVDSSDSRQGSQSGYAVDGSVSAGNVEIQSGRGEVHGRDQIRIIRRSTGSRSGGIQQIQATEGSPALIQVGQSVPVTSAGAGPYGEVYSQTEYRDAVQGIYVTATLSGNLVHVTLSARNDRFDPSYPGAINTGGAETHVSGRLGEWIEIGGVSQNSRSQQGGFGRSLSTQGYQDSSLRLKVESID